jgi:hypothetical protein
MIDLLQWDYGIVMKSVFLSYLEKEEKILASEF